MKREKMVALPTDVAGLDRLVQLLVKKFKLPNTDDTYDAIATKIMHLPGHQAFVPLSYLGHSVWKMMANAASYTKLEEFRIKREKKHQKEIEKQKAEAENKKLKVVGDGAPISNAQSISGT